MRRLFIFRITSSVSVGKTVSLKGKQVLYHRNVCFYGLVKLGNIVDMLMK